MNKIRTWIGSNILFLATLALLVIIPLYPKLPLLDIQHTWVYIRIEDFLVALALLIFATLLFLKKVTLKTPLTFPIMVFWVVGGIATLHGVFFLFPTLEGVHPNVAFLSYLRRIEYMSLFFIAYASIYNKKNIYPIIVIITSTLLLVVAYGLGQRFLGFPAFLTMNEEFAKGIPIQLTEFSRISSTFAGHYDLAAYLVLIVPILASLVFGFRNIFIKAVLLISSLLGFILLFMTVSRVSFVVLLVSLGIVLMFQKKRIVFMSLLVIGLMLLMFAQPLLQRFGSTVSEVEVLVDAKTGVAIGPVKQVENTYFKDIFITIKNHNESAEAATISAVFPYAHVPPVAALVVEPNSATGENLSQGTSYINLSLSPVVKKVPLYFFEKTNTASPEADVYLGEYVIKKAKAYDLSATTRFQGEWPRTFAAFQKNVFLGSGYGAVSLAVDNNYLRILGESGIFGLLAFISIFVFAGVYIRKTLPFVDSPVVRTFVLGFVAGSVGLALNAVLIDVFEASKIAFTYWILMGVILGILNLYTKDTGDILTGFKKAILSSWTIAIVLVIISIGLFFSIYENYFVSMDYTWLRLASSCYTSSVENSIKDCPFTIHTVTNFFSQTTQNFYRPATILYFYFMHMAFWLNQSMYHIVSLTLYAAVTVIVFLLLKHIFKEKWSAILGTIFFLVLSGNSQAVFWIASTDILFATCLALLALLFFVYWEVKEKNIYFFLSLIFSFIAPFFHESALIVPLLVVLYDRVLGKNIISQKMQRRYLFFYVIPLLGYFIIRFSLSGQLWSESYTVGMIPINTIGYILLGILGPAAFSIYQKLQTLGGNILFVILITCVLGLGIAAAYYGTQQYLPKPQRKLVVFGLSFFLLAILPFVGMPTILIQNGYLPNVGIIILLTIFLKWMYAYLKQTQDTFISVTISIIICIVFSMVHIFQIQTLEVSGKEVSKKSEQFLISFSDHYIDQWKDGQWQFYFINVPNAPGEPWVEPRSLVDAIWFVTQNQNTNIILENNVTKALDAADKNENIQVFEFQSDGSVKKIVRRTVKGKTMIYKE